MTAISLKFTASNRRNFIAFIGDSYTYNESLGCRGVDFYPYQIETRLRAAGAAVTAKNFGIGGQTTGQMLARIAMLTLREVPAFASIYGGGNDPQYNTTVASASSSSVFTVQTGLGVNYIAGTYVLVNGVSALIASVSTDTITLSAALAGGTPANGSSISIDTQTNIVKMGQALIAAGVKNLIVCGMHYLNFSSGGDTHATPRSDNASLRVIQSAAATSLNTLATAVGGSCVYVNFWSWMDALIQSVAYTQGDNLWHAYANNTHLNAVGESILADAIMARIPSGWINKISA